MKTRIEIKAAGVPWRRIPDYVQYNHEGKESGRKFMQLICYLHARAQ